MITLQVTINNLKEVIISADLVLQKLEKAQKDLDKPPEHKWEHGDVLENRWGVSMIYIRRFGKTHLFCAPGTCDSEHIPEEILPEAKFLFNIKEKL